MYWFQSEGKYEMDRGTVYSVRNPVEFERGECPFIGQVAIIDGVPFTCKDVESYALQTIREGAPIGLLVEDIK